MLSSYTLLINTSIANNKDAEQRVQEYRAPINQKESNSNNSKDKLLAKSVYRDNNSI